MSLNSESMLPKRVRMMRQMEELLNAEDLVLAELERIIDGMYREASLIQEELVNEEWLERHLLELTGSQTKVTGDAQNLMVNVQFDLSDQDALDLKSIRDFLHKWLPAHLQYKLRYLLEYTFANQEKFLLSAIIIELTSPFFDVRTLDGTWLLDGTYCLDAVRKADDCGIGYDIGNVKPTEKIAWGMIQLIRSWIAEQYTGLKMIVGSGYVQCSPLVRLERLDISMGAISQPECYQTGVILKQDYWELDGSYLLNGLRGLNATKTEEEL